MIGERTGRDLFAAAHDRIGRSFAGKLRSWPEHLPESLLKAALPFELDAHSLVIRLVGHRWSGADIDCGGKSGNDPFRLGGACTAKAGSIADSEYGIDAAAAVFIVARSQKSMSSVIAVAAAEQPGKLVGRQKSVTHADHIHLVASTTRQGNGEAPTGIDPIDRRRMD